MSDLANAVLISGSPGFIDGDNKLPGETANWFKWHPPAAGYYIFSTRFNPGGISTNFKTLLSAFTLSSSPSSPVVLTDLTVVDYLPGGQFGTGVGYELGSMIAFNVPDKAVTYYIMVDSRDGSRGTFDLEWGGFSREILGACGDCLPPTTGLCKAGGANLTSYAGPPNYDQFISAGSYPAGLYVIQPCSAPENFIFLCLHSGAFETYSSVGSPRNCNDPHSAGVAGCDCTSLGPCQPWLICHSGGIIGFYSQFLAAGGVLGVPFQVAILPFKIAEQLQVTVKSIHNNGFTNGVDASAGYNYSVTITVKNKNLFYSTSQFETFTGQSTPDARIQMTAATNASGISPSASASFVLAGGAHQDFIYSFNSVAKDQITGTFRITDCTGATYDVNLVLGTSLVSFVQANFNQFCTGLPIKPTDTRIVLKNNGPVPAGSVVITFGSTTPGGVLFLQALPQPVCVGGGAASGTYGSNGTFSLPTIPPFFLTGPGSGALFTFDVGIIRNDAGQPLNQTINGAMTDAGIAVPPFNFNVVLL
jgi:hypothetical protein